MNREAFESYLQLDQEHFWRKAKRQLVLGWLDDMSPTGRVLDIGGAASLITRELKRYGSVTVVEPDRGMIEIARKSSGIDVIAGGFPGLPVSGSFDLITLLDVLEHLDDDRAALAEIRRLLRPSGIFLLTVPAYMWLWTDHDVALHHKRRYARSELHALLGEAGFDVLRISYYTSFLLPVLAAQRMVGQMMASRRAGRATQPAVYRVKTPPPLVNRACGAVMAFERWLLRRYRLPAGGAIIALCR